MWGFAAGVAAELGSHESIVQQAAGHPFGVTFFMLLISVASVMPKFASGVPIGMHALLGFEVAFFINPDGQSGHRVLVSEDVSCNRAGELHDAASRGSLPGPLAFFNKTHEIWVGAPHCIALYIIHTAT